MDFNNIKLPTLEEVLKRAEDIDEIGNSSKLGFENYFCSKKEESDGYGKVQVSGKFNLCGQYSIICNNYNDSFGSCKIGKYEFSDCPYNNSETKIQGIEHQRDILKKV